MRILSFLLAFALAQTARADDVQGIFYNPTLHEFQGSTRANGIVGFQQGITDGSVACAGCLGEVIANFQARANAVSLSNNTDANIFSASSTNGTTKITLTPGDWDITGCITFSTSGATITNYDAAISKTSATEPASTTFANASNNGEIRLRNPTSLTTVSIEFTDCIPTIQTNVTVKTDYYLVTDISFSAGTVSAYGSLRARRAH